MLAEIVVLSNVFEQGSMYITSIVAVWPQVLVLQTELLEDKKRNISYDPIPIELHFRGAQYQLKAAVFQQPNEEFVAHLDYKIIADSNPTNILWELLFYVKLE